MSSIIYVQASYKLQDTTLNIFVKTTLKKDISCTLEVSRVFRGYVRIFYSVSEMS